METFSALLALCVGNPPVTVDSLHKGQWHGTLVFSLICAWTKGWESNQYADDLRRCRTHYDDIPVPVKQPWRMWINCLLSGVPDFFDRNKILSGYDLSHYQVPHCIRVFFYFV